MKLIMVILQYFKKK